MGSPKYIIIFIKEECYTMGKGIFKRLVSGIVTGLLCLTSVPSGIGLSSRAADDYQQTGTLDGYDYEVWNQYSQGTISFIPGNAGTYSCSWSGIHNILFRSGKKWSSNPQWDTLDGIQVDYACDYNPNGNSYLCVYGWTQNPLVEYYIVESYGSWRPPGTSDTMAMVGTITVDGGTYEVYKGTHDGPSIESGVTHFNQYWSVRVDSQLRTSGTIDVSKHFKAWEDQFGMDMGGLHEVALNVEGWQSSGSANVTKNDLTIGGGTSIDPDPVVEPDENGYYFFDDFEDGNGLWGKRGNTTLTTDTENYYSSGSSVLVSGRTDTWQGIGRSLDPTVFVPGKTYSFGAGVLQTNGATEAMKLTLEYKDSAGETQYRTVASADAESGVWTKLENTAYTIPTGASAMLLYVESDSTNSFYIDDAFGGVEGTKSTVTTGGGTVKGAVEPTTSAPTIRNWGDANNDGDITVADATLIMQYLATSDSAVFKDEDGKLNADVHNCGDGITANDALSIQKYLAGAVTELPVSYSASYLAQLTTTTTTTTAPPATTTAVGGVDISWIDPSKPMVAISFDDGAVGTYQGASSMRIINAIADAGFHATFFYVGSWTNTTDKENEVKYAYSKGMEIANHTTTHPKLTDISDSEIRSEYDTTAAKLKGIIGAEPSPLLRLPYLAYNDTVTRVLSDVPMISCKVDTGDWNKATKDQIISKITTAMQDGSLDNSIVLCHETYDTTAEAMEYLAPYLKSQGWQIVTVSEMFAVNGKTLDGGKVYTACY